MYAQVLAYELRQPERGLFVIHLGVGHLSVGKEPVVAVCSSVGRHDISLLDLEKRGFGVAV
jgi:hypothetical protein